MNLFLVVLAFAYIHCQAAHWLTQDILTSFTRLCGPLSFTRRDLVCWLKSAQPRETDFGDWWCECGFQPCQQSSVWHKCLLDKSAPQFHPRKQGRTQLLHPWGAVGVRQDGICGHTWEKPSSVRALKTNLRESWRTESHPSVFPPSCLL